MKFTQLKDLPNGTLILKGLAKLTQNELNIIKKNQLKIEHYKYSTDLDIVVSKEEYDNYIKKLNKERTITIPMIVTFCLKDEIKPNNEGKYEIIIADNIYKMTDRCGMFDMFPMATIDNVLDKFNKELDKIKTIEINRLYHFEYNLGNKDSAKIKYKTTLTF